MKPETPNKQKKKIKRRSFLCYSKPQKQKAALTQNFLPDLAPTPSPTADIFFRRLQKSSLDARIIMYNSSYPQNLHSSSRFSVSTSKENSPNEVEFSASCLLKCDEASDGNEESLEIPIVNPISVLKDNGVLYLNEPAYAIKHEVMDEGTSIEPCSCSKAHGEILVYFI
ncbi:DNA replication licensing factor MCM4 [Bienertia sinuspersici]